MRARRVTAWPPEGDAPARCRWCGGRRLLLGPDLGWYCPRGCAGSDETPTTGHCEVCGAAFRTGLPLMEAVLCPRCADVGADDVGEARGRALLAHESYDRALAGDVGEQFRRALRRRAASLMRSAVR